MNPTSWLDNGFDITRIRRLHNAIANRDAKLNRFFLSRRFVVKDLCCRGYNFSAEVSLLMIYGVEDTVDLNLSDI